MGRMIPLLATTAAVLLLGLGASAQPAEAPANPPGPAAAEAPAEDVTLVDALIVRAARPGPAFWKVSDGDSTVWVMGVPGALPKGLNWKHEELRAHLRNANVLIVGTGGYTFNIADIIRLMFSANRFKADKPLNQVLPPELMTRFETARKNLDVPDRILELKPGFAGIFLAGSFQRSLKMDQGQPERSITRDAFLRVRTDRVGRSNIVDVLSIFEEMPPAMAQTCVEDALRQIEAGSVPLLDSARGWTTGDLRLTITAERGLDRCIESDPAVKTETDRNLAEVTAAILEALKKPGKSVAVVDLRPLLLRDGIIVRLMAQPGVKVTTPDVPGMEDEIGAEAAEPEKAPEATAPAI